MKHKKLEKQKTLRKIEGKYYVKYRSYCGKCSC